MHTVEHFPEKSMFAIVSNGHEAKLQYAIEEGRVIIVHTHVPPELEGKGMASTLARHVLSFLQQHQTPTVVLCPYIKGYMKRHPEYNDILDREYARRFRKSFAH